MIKDLETQLKDIFNKIELEKRNIEVFIEYILLLKQWNKNINIISKKEKNIVSNLIAPSLLFFKLLDDFKEEKTVIDLGSGAGFPAFVIKIYDPKINVTMIEINRKKATFLRYVSLNLRLNCHIIEQNLFDVKEEEIKDSAVTTARGINVTSDIIDWVKRKTKSKWLVHFTSPKIHLPLALVKKREIGFFSVKLYKL